jgi:hypothetical protein
MHHSSFILHQSNDETNSADLLHLSCAATPDRTAREDLSAAVDLLFRSASAASAWPPLASPSGESASDSMAPPAEAVTPPPPPPLVLVWGAFFNQVTRVPVQQSFGASVFVVADEQFRTGYDGVLTVRHVSSNCVTVSVDLRRVNL